MPTVPSTGRAAVSRTWAPRSQWALYQKTNAISEIKRVGRDRFWAKAEKEEENRRLEEKRWGEEEWQPPEKEHREQQLREASHPE